MNLSGTFQSRSATNKILPSDLSWCLWSRRIVQPGPIKIWKKRRKRKKVTQSCPTLCSPIDYSPWSSPGQNIRVGSFSLLQVIFSTPGTEPRFPTLQVDSSPAEPQGKPKNTGVGSLSLLQWIFLIQESNQGLLYCRQILYQLSSQGSR